MNGKNTIKIAAMYGILAAFWAGSMVVYASGIEFESIVTEIQVSGILNSPAGIMATHFFLSLVVVLALMLNRGFRAGAYIISLISAISLVVISIKELNLLLVFLYILALWFLVSEARNIWLVRGGG